MSTENPVQEDAKTFACQQCGGKLQFSPGVSAMKCPYCQFENAIPQSEEDIHELDYLEQLSRLAHEAETEEHFTAKCDGCGAETTFDPNVAGSACPFCATPLVTSGGSTREIKPKSLLPFKVERDAAQQTFATWLKRLWFAPNALKKTARLGEPLTGIYVPYWTYDSDTVTFYRGERGEHYWETQTYTTRENGKTVTKTRRVRKTRWYRASGTVWNRFDDLLVMASHSLPDKYAEKLEPWDLENLEPYQPEYLSGFKTENYQVGLEQGMEEAKGKMEPVIRKTVRRDIGGDEQRIHSMRTQYSNVTFKHILLPVWLSAYRYKETVYRFMVNARTGEPQGERPWSWVKILLAVLGGLAVAGGIVALIAAQSGH